MVLIRARSVKKGARNSSFLGAEEGQRMGVYQLFTERLEYADTTSTSDRKARKGPSGW